MQPTTLGGETALGDDQPSECEDVHVEDTAIPQNASLLPTLPEGSVVATNDSCHMMEFRAAKCSSSSGTSSTDIPVSSKVPLPPLLRKTKDGMRLLMQTCTQILFTSSSSQDKGPWLY